MKKKGHYRADAVILNTFDYAESDRIVTFYTLEAGKLAGIAKGARRSRRRFVGNLEPLSRVRIMYHYNPSSELVRVEDSTLVDGFYCLKEDIERLAAGSYLVELANAMTREGQTNAALFELLTGFLEVFDRVGPTEAFLRYFEVRLLKATGYMPRFESCVVCSGVFDTGEGAGVDTGGFSPDRGGMVCKGCAPQTLGLMRVSAKTAGLLSTAAALPVDALSRLAVDAVFIEEAARLLDDSIRRHTGRVLKSKSFMKKLAATPLNNTKGGRDPVVHGGGVGTPSTMEGALEPRHGAVVHGGGARGRQARTSD
jgi:DNA repair protein RecO (recombination protein O)